MSNFYYCNDCKKVVDLRLVQYKFPPANPIDVHECKECGGTNWEVRS